LNGALAHLNGVMAQGWIAGHILGAGFAISALLQAGIL
jgi:hypothetical protein